MILLGIAVIVLVVVFIRGGEKLSSLGDASSLTDELEEAGGSVSGLVRQKTTAWGADKLDSQLDKSRTALSEGGASSKSASGVKARVLVCGAAIHGFWIKFQVKLKILISLLQVLNGMGFVFSIPYPPFYSDSVRAVAGIFEIDLPSVMPLDCIFVRSQHAIRTRAPFCSLPTGVCSNIYSGSR